MNENTTPSAASSDAVDVLVEVLRPIHALAVAQVHLHCTQPTAPHWQAVANSCEFVLAVLTGDVPTAAIATEQPPVSRGDGGEQPRSPGEQITTTTR
ncbi:MAG: hypothetical protein ACTHU0_39230 [Kofleriaceae bacterium]